MQKITLPGTELNVSRMAFGCWGITSDMHWGNRDESTAVASIHAALDAGVNFFDTAEMYANGDSELLIGRELSGKRDDVVIATKMRPDSMSADAIPEACERSLKRLNTDYIDLYQMHWVSPDVPAAETWQAMQQLKTQGKVREIGVCNMGLGHLSEVSEKFAPATNQLPYNLLWRALEHEVLPHCQSSGIGVLAYSPLMHGLLADKYKTAADVPDGRARSRHFSGDRELARHGEAGCEDATFAAIDAVRKICAGLDRPMAEVALAWCLSNSAVSCVIAGCGNSEQLNANLAAFANPLSQDVVSALSDATAPLKEALGSNADMWQGDAGSRYR